jgi:hypothetical protein
MKNIFMSKVDENKKKVVKFISEKYFNFKFILYIFIKLKKKMMWMLIWVVILLLFGENLVHEAQENRIDSQDKIFIFIICFSISILFNLVLGIDWL